MKPSPPAPPPRKPARRTCRKPNSASKPAITCHRLVQPSGWNLIRALGEFQTVASAGVLARIFAREKRLDAKMKVLEVMADNREETCREVKLSILCAGVADTQSRQVRLAALGALLDVDDPRLPRILQKMAADRDPLIRSEAAEALQK